MSAAETTIRRTIGRSRLDGSYIEAVCELRRAGNARGLSPAFSVTGSLYEKRGTWDGRAQKRNGREEDAGGCIHGEILRTFPCLAPLVALHLADPYDGAPMHAEANGWYFYSGAARRWEETHDSPGANREGLSDAERAARALRIRPTELPDGLDRPGFAAFVDSLRDRWRREAEAGVELLESLADGDGVEPG